MDVCVSVVIASAPKTTLSLSNFPFVWLPVFKMKVGKEKYVVLIGARSLFAHYPSQVTLSLIQFLLVKIRIKKIRTWGWMTHGLFLSSLSHLGRVSEEGHKESSDTHPSKGKSGNHPWVHHSPLGERLFLSFSFSGEWCVDSVGAPQGVFLMKNQHPSAQTRKRKEKKVV